MSAGLAGWIGLYDSRGFLASFWGLLAAIAAAVLVSLATAAQPEADLDRAFGRPASGGDPPGGRGPGPGHDGAART